VPVHILIYDLGITNLTINLLVALGVGILTWRLAQSDAVARLIKLAPPGRVSSLTGKMTD
jgi:hypothetical protein